MTMSDIRALPLWFMAWALAAGSHDWMPATLRFDVPETATRVRLSIKMMLGDELRARNPGLRELEP